MNNNPFKETPIHPSTPDFSENVKDFVKRDNLGNIRGYSTVWASAAAEVNNRGFKVLVPMYVLSKPIEEPKEIESVSYMMGTKVKSKYTHKTPIPSSFYSPVVADQRIQTKLPLVRLIDLYLEGEYFAVVDHVEQIQMFLLMDAYLEEIKDHVKADAPGFADFALKVLRCRPEFYRHFVRSLHAFMPRAEAFNNYKKSLNSPFLSRLLGLSPKDRKDGISRMEPPPYKEEWVQSIIERREKVNEGKPAENINLTEDYLKKSDGEIKFKDPFDQEASQLLPELNESAGRTNLNGLLTKGF